MGLEVIGNHALTCFVEFLSIKVGSVPQLWKASCLVPLAKLQPKEHSSYRPAAPTAHLMKTLVRLVLVHQWSMSSTHRFLTLKKAGSPVRIMVFDFFSGENHGGFL